MAPGLGLMCSSVRSDQEVMGFGYRLFYVIYSCERPLWECHVLRGVRDREEEVVAGGLGSTPTYYLLSGLRDCSRVERSEQCVPMHFMQMYPEAVCVSVPACVCMCK